jgi:hypothetical protein
MTSLTSKMGGQLTAGLNNPPLTLKNTHTFTISENPKLNAIKSRTLVSGACVMLPPCCPAVDLSVAVADALATCVPPNAKKRNINVPANSAAAATSSFFHFVLMRPSPGPDAGP